MRGEHMKSPEARMALSERNRARGIVPPQSEAQRRAAQEKGWASNRGRKRTPEQIARIAAASSAGKEGKPHPMLGKKHSPETRAKLSESHTGKVGPLASNWRGGIYPAHRAARSTPEYREWRQLVFQRDDYTCQRCSVRGGILHANHIYAFADFPERRTDINNGVTLCQPCHLYISSSAGHAAEPHWYIRAAEVA